MSSVDVTVKKDGLRNQLDAAKDAQPITKTKWRRNEYSLTTTNTP